MADPRQSLAARSTVLRALVVTALGATALGIHGSPAQARSNHLRRNTTVTKLRRMGIVGNLRWLLRKPRTPRPARRSASRAADLDKALALLRKPIAKSAWSHLRWAQLRRRVEKELRSPSTIDQGKLHLCMSAVAMNLTAERNPLRYVELVREVYEQGSFNGLAISAKLRRQRPEGAPRGKRASNSLDWMLLSASRNAYGRPSFAGKAGFRPSAINLPGEMNRLLREVSGFSQVRSVSRFLRSGAKLIPALNRHLAEQSGEVVLLMSMKGLRPGQRHHDMHWTRLLAPIERLPAAKKVASPRFDPLRGSYVVRWRERDGRRQQKTLGDHQQAEAFAKMLNQPRVKLLLFDHGKKLPVHISERTFGRQLLYASFASDAP